MTPQQQAKLILFDYLQIVKYMYEAKLCTKLSIKLIIENTEDCKTKNYWIEVLKEIEAL